MATEEHKTGKIWLPVWIYGALGAAAVAYAWYKGAYDAAHSEFAGMPLIILGLPWSWMFHNFNPRIVSDEYNNSILVESMFIGVNVVLLGLLVTAIKRRTGRDFTRRA